MLFWTVKSWITNKLFCFSDHPERIKGYSRTQLQKRFASSLYSLASLQWSTSDQYNFCIATFFYLKHEDTSLEHKESTLKQKTKRDTKHHDLHDYYPNFPFISNTPITITSRPVIDTVRVGCLGFSSHLWQAGFFFSSYDIRLHLFLAALKWCIFSCWLGVNYQSPTPHHHQSPVVNRLRRQSTVFLLPFHLCWFRFSVDCQDIFRFFLIWFLEDYLCKSWWPHSTIDIGCVQKIFTGPW